MLRRCVWFVNHSAVHRYRRLLMAAVDMGAWALALAVTAVIRLNLDHLDGSYAGVMVLMPIACATQVLWGSVFGLYTGRWVVGGFDEAAALAKTVTCATAMLFLIDVVASQPFLAPRGVVLAGGLTALFVMAALRYLYRSLDDRRRRPSSTGAQRVLVFGVGDGGKQIVTAMLRDPSSEFLPVGLLDDSPTERNRRIRGVPVLGDRRDLLDAAQRSKADVLLIAIPRADAQLISELTSLASSIELPVKVLPSMGELLGDPISVWDIRDVNEADLLGRCKVETDLDSIAGYVTGKRVLVTGAGGSIGSELCRQLHRFAPSELIMLDQDESALHGVMLSIHGKPLLDSPDLVLHDVRDQAGLYRLFARRKPQVVFHAAALKHLPILERHPEQAVKTNVWGTLALLRAAAEHGVERFVNISTDKAANPCSVLGYSKHIGERLTAEVAREAQVPYLSVRFGNVLNSRGSVLQTFGAQIEAGGPVTVTHPEVSRFFMTTEEAVQLVIQAGAIGRGGEALVLDMGESVRIADVARMLTSRSKRPIDIVFTGLRPGEKLHEVLFGPGEQDHRPVHNLISHVQVSPLPADAVQGINSTAPVDELISELRHLCNTRARSLQSLNSGIPSSDI